jgi:hypothetical protein
MLDEEWSVLRQVAGEEDHQDHLEQLRWLAADRAEVDRQACTAAAGVVTQHEREQ